MKYREEIVLRNGEVCLLKQGEAQDAEEVLRSFLLAHGETEFLATYPEESAFTPESERAFLQRQETSENAVELCAFVGGKVVGTAGVLPVGMQEKLRHRAVFGVSVEREHWGKGIGRALTAACIECAKRAGYLQLELEAVRENERAVALYQSFGFIVCGSNPKGFRTRSGRFQELVSMRLEL